MSAAQTFCVNHPQTETLLRCNKCERPVCIKCVQRTPVGYRCKQCLNVQQAGFYTAEPTDHFLAAIVGIIVAIIGGAIAGVISSIWLLMIFYGPFAGGVIAEIIRAAIQKRRGRYIWLIACASVIVGGFIGAGAGTAITFLFSSAQRLGGLGALLAFPIAAFANLLNLGFWIYLALAVSTVYARLR
ncbi:MAG: hypothetical protein HZC40_18115 [Chloroflexi bacterium]|nr:hypothetical protein [Chloroflexota bacterium]